MEKIKSWIERYEADRQLALAKIGTPSTIAKYENIIRKKLAQNFAKYKDGYFTSQIFENIPLLKKYFKFYVAITDRNKGKSWNSRRKIERVYLSGKKSILLRNRPMELDKLIASEGFTLWLQENNWHLKVKDYTIYDGKNVVCYLRALNDISATKSVDYPGVDLVIYDEFDSNIKIKDKFFKLAHFMTTAGRNNTNLKIYLFSNYENLYDDIFTSLGVDITTTSNRQLIHINWIMGSILCYFPTHYFKSGVSVHETLGGKMSLVSPEVYAKQHGATYLTYHATNFSNYQDIGLKTYIFSVRFNDEVIHFFKTEHFILADTKVFDLQDLKLVAFREKDKLQDVRATIISDTYLEMLKNCWLTNKLKVINENSYSVLQNFFNYVKIKKENE